jgi:hypothetical protein
MHFVVATPSLGMQVEFLTCDNGVKLCSVKIIPMFKENFLNVCESKED